MFYGKPCKYKHTEDSGNPRYTKNKVCVRCQDIWYTKLKQNPERYAKELKKCAIRCKRYRAKHKEEISKKAREITRIKKQEKIDK